MTVAVAVIVSVLAPVLLAALTNRQRRQERLENWARQDAIESKQQQNSDKLDVIHHLVNSQLTAVMKGEAEAVARELAATQRELIMMKQLVDLHSLNNTIPSASSLLDIARTEASIERLTDTLSILTAKLQERHKNDDVSLEEIRKRVEDGDA